MPLVLSRFLSTRLLALLLGCAAPLLCGAVLRGAAAAAAVAGLGPAAAHPDLNLGASPSDRASLWAGFQAPPPVARPWVFWYWMRGAVSREGITADLEAMREAGIGGACLMCIKGPDSTSTFPSPVAQLTPEWWALLDHAFAEAGRLGLRLSMGSSDGFATAGGPWITPELSMQRIVWSSLLIEDSSTGPLQLPLPALKENFYKDLQVVAVPFLGAPFPAPLRVSSSLKTEAATPALFVSDSAPLFRAETAAWLLAEYESAQTLRSLTLPFGGGNYQSNRLRIEASLDGLTFWPVCTLEPPRHGWLDSEQAVTHSIPETTARFFRFQFDPAGSEPGGEDLDSAKWKPVLKLRGLRLSSLPLIEGLEGKNGSVWRLSSSAASPGAHGVPLASLLDLSARLSSDGTLDWTPPPGSWQLLRIGVTTTGQVNATGGAARGLECDKLNPLAVRLQFDSWYARLLAQAGPERTPSVLDTFHVDSWECGSQNWSPVLPAEFERRRGYALTPFLPILTGLPLVSSEFSEQFLHDYRLTLSELVVDNFYGTLAPLVHARGLAFSGECTAPIMAADGLAPYRLVDIPMGEFWLRSPTHDKPNDLSDAVSAAHIYGKQLIQAESFTELRMAWDEHPGMLKTLGDRHFALGVNRLMLHVFAHNPWLDRSPGMTLDPIGLFFQRDQTWWSSARAWTDYLARSQFLLQQGTPVVDIAVFSGEEIPSRSVLPGRLIHTLPGLLGKERVARELARVENKGQPRRTLPAGVTASANIPDSADFLDPLSGYAYDSLNRDALLNLARVEKGRIVLPGGASYALLVFLSQDPLQPGAATLSLPLAEKLASLVKDGASVLLGPKPQRAPGLTSPDDTQRLFALIDELWGACPAQTPSRVKGRVNPGPLLPRVLGKGRVFQGAWQESSLQSLALPADFLAAELPLEGTTPSSTLGTLASAPVSLAPPYVPASALEGLVWTHRSLAAVELYYVSNQLPQARRLALSLRAPSVSAEIWDPLTGARTAPLSYACTTAQNRSTLSFEVAPSGAVFVLLFQNEPSASKAGASGSPSAPLPPLSPAPTESSLCEQVLELTSPWSLSFPQASGVDAFSLTLPALASWSGFEEPRLRYFSGTATYAATFNWAPPGDSTSAQHLPLVYLDLGRLANTASVELNGVQLGTLWTPPYRVLITPALRVGQNALRIQVSNTWANRLHGDHLSPGRPGATWTSAPWLLEGAPLLEAGLLGPLRLLSSAPKP